MATRPLSDTILLTLAERFIKLSVLWSILHFGVVMRPGTLKSLYCTVM